MELENWGLGVGLVGGLENGLGWGLVIFVR